MGKTESTRKDSFLKFSCVSYAAVGAYSNLWPGGLISLEIMKIMWENDATVWIQITMYCFQAIHGGYFLTQPRILALSAVRRICCLFTRNCAVLELMSFVKLLDSGNTHRHSAQN